MVRDNHIQSLSSIDEKLKFSNLSDLTAYELSVLIEERRELIKELDRLDSSINFYCDLALVDYESVLKFLPPLPEHLREDYQHTRINVIPTDSFNTYKKKRRRKVNKSAVSNLLFVACLLIFLITSVLTTLVSRDLTMLDLSRKYNVVYYISVILDFNLIYIQLMLQIILSLII